MKIVIYTLFFLTLFFKSVYSETISDVKVENNKRVSKESIIAFGNIDIGTDYSEEKLNKVLIDLYDSSFFSDVKLKIINNVLIVNVTERKIIQSVIINGIKSKENTENILKQLSLKAKSPFDDFTAERDLIKLKSSLNRAGYYFAKVNVTIKENNNDTVDLIYNIDTVSITMCTYIFNII